jgi:uncharacterized protein YbjQ (UPF0145 family)
MMMKKALLLSFAAMMILAAGGCVSYEYKGEKAAEPTVNVDVYSDSSKILRRYEVLGEASVSGNYQDVSRDRMIDKLVSEAGKCGANGILLVEQQVVPVGGSTDNRFMTAFDYDDTSQSWSQIYRDVDERYGSIRNWGSSAGNSATAPQSYRRIIRAEFIKYLPAEETAVEK